MMRMDDKLLTGRAMSVHPSDILIIGENTCEKVIAIKLKLSKVLAEDCYVIYPYSSETSTYVPKPENVALIISTLNEFKAQTHERILRYFSEGGNIITNAKYNCSAPCTSWQDLGSLGSFCRGDHTGSWIETSSDLETLSEGDWAEMLTKILRPSFVLKAAVTSPKAKLMSSVAPGTLNNAAVTKAVLMGFPQDLIRMKENILKSSPEGKIQQSKTLLDFSPGENPAAPSENYIPIFSQASSLNFDWEIYKSHLLASRLGRVVLHTETARSTTDFLDGPKFLHDGIAVIADRQTQGKGRAGNIWLSPVGCAMFSMQVMINNPRRASLLQHLVALAAVHGIRTMDGYQDLDIRLKWPNDIYFGRQSKLGGVLVHCSFFKNKLTCNIGMGVNLNNEHPTVSINQIIIQHNLLNPNGPGLKLIPREQFFAQTFNLLESFISKVETEQGLKEILDLYHYYWLHSNQEVTLKMDGLGGEPSGRVVRLDRDGYLVVKLSQSGQLVTAHPDGNSFDMMQGLIVPKVTKKDG